jgi:hypothetical protein
MRTLEVFIPDKQPLAQAGKEAPLEPKRAKRNVSVREEKLG